MNAALTSYSPFGMSNRNGLGDFDDDYGAGFIDLSQYQNTLDWIAPQTTSMIQQTAVPGESWYDTLSRLMQSMVLTYQQKQMMDVQISRARAGLPPLTTTPTSGQIDQKTLLIIGAIVIAAMMLRKN